MNGIAPPPNLQGRKDVVLVPSQQTVKFITKFETFCDSVPYMYHCHMLKHEDEGMMGQFRVNCTTTGVDELSGQTPLAHISPNPAFDRLTLLLPKNPSGAMRYIKVIDATGKTIHSENTNSDLVTLQLQNWLPGMYTIMISLDSGIQTSRFILSR
jgi:bilirubin oxidase